MFSGSYSLVSAYHTSLTLLCTVPALKKRLKIFKKKIHIKMVLYGNLHLPKYMAWKHVHLRGKNTAVILRVNTIYYENKAIAIL